MLELKVLESSDLTEVTIYGPYLNRYRTRWMMQSLAEWHRQRQERGEKPDGSTPSSFLSSLPVHNPAHFKGGWWFQGVGPERRWASLPGPWSKPLPGCRGAGPPSWLPRSYLRHLRLLRGCPSPSW